MRSVVICLAFLLPAFSYAGVPDAQKKSGEYKNVMDKYASWEKNYSGFQDALNSMDSLDDKEGNQLARIQAELGRALGYLHTVIELGAMVSGCCASNESTIKYKSVMVKSAFVSIKNDLAAARVGFAAVQSNADKVKLGIRMQKTIEDIISTLAREISLVK